MHRRGVTGWRLARACALAGTSLLLSFVAHLLGGGQAPSVLAVVGPGVPLLVAAFLLAGRRRGPLVVGSALVLGQALAHETLMLMSLPAESGPGSVGEVMVHSMHGAGGSMSGAMVLQSSAPTVAMVAWHAVATAAIAAGLAFGERAVRHLVRWALPPRPPAAQLAAPLVVSPVQAVDHPVTMRQPWLRSVSRRGPPGGVSASFS